MAQAGDEFEGKGIIVTSEKLGRSLRETTSSVGVVGAQRLANTTPDTVYDALEQIGNVIAQPFGYSIRGIATQGLAQNFDSDTSTILVDGVALERFAALGNDFAVWDAERIEVLRGPQSTMLGRNSLAGAIVVKTRDPGERWDLATRGQYFSGPGRQFAVAGGGPLIGEALAFRIAYDDRATDGTLRNVTLVRDDWGRESSRTLRGKLRLRASDSVQALYTYSRGERRHSGFNLDLEEFFLRERVSVVNVDEFEQTRTDTHSLALEARLGESLSLSSLSAFSDTDYRTRSDPDNSAADDVDGFNRASERGFSQEVRLRYAAADGRARGVFGLFYGDGARTQDIGARLSLAAAAQLFGLCPVAAACPILFADQFTNAVVKAPRDARNRALFAEGDWRLLPRWTLTLGLRYDRETQERSSQTVIVGEGPTAVAVVTAGMAAGLFPPPDNSSARSDFDALLPKLGLRYAFSDQWSLGAQVQDAYRAGGAVANAIQGRTIPFGPEFTRNYEVALRGVAGDLQVNVNAFYTDWRDQQVEIGSDFDSVIVNSGRSHLLGGELELNGRVWAPLDAFLSMGYTRTEFDEFRNGEMDFADNEFPQAPRFTGSAGMVWRLSADAALSVDVRQASGVFSDVANSAEFRTRAYTLLNARFTLTPRFAPGLRLWAQGRNLGEAAYATYLQRTTFSQSRLNGRFGETRIVSAGLEYSF